LIQSLYNTGLLVNQMHYLIGIDAGGTKTAAAAYDSVSGERLCGVEGPQGSFSVDSISASENVINAIEACMEICGEACEFICVGAAGLGDPLKRKLLSDKLVEHFRCSVLVVDDGRLALHAALGGNDGLLVISGTGSIVYGKKGSNVRRYGGWGHLLDDRGSGYDISISAFRQMMADYDAGKQMSPLSCAVMRFLHVETVQEVVSFLYSVPKGKIASIVPVVAKLAQGGDPQAAALLDCAGERLAEMAVNLCKKMQFEAVRIVPMGSILLKCRPVAYSFREYVKHKLPDAQLITSTNEPTKGGYYLYQSLQNEEE